MGYLKLLGFFAFTESSSVVLFIESQEFFFSFSLHFPADGYDYAETMDFTNWMNGCLLEYG